MPRIIDVVEAPNQGANDWSPVSRKSGPATSAWAAR
jgi:hypothetical protein